MEIEALVDEYDAEEGDGRMDTFRVFPAPTQRRHPHPPHPTLIVDSFGLPPHRRQMYLPRCRCCSLPALLCLACARGVLEADPAAGSSSTRIHPVSMVRAVTVTCRSLYPSLRFSLGTSRIPAGGQATPPPPRAHSFSSAPAHVVQRRALLVELDHHDHRCAIFRDFDRHGTEHELRRRSASRRRQERGVARHAYIVRRLGRGGEGGREREAGDEGKEGEGEEERESGGGGESEDGGDGGGVPVLLCVQA
ncbi:hypothetical protein C8R45DRAFT_1183361 [Mycena sanguinolenta]|nr:hypothetical protein C8R45DRAFT_1183361 [Mycena sanguinolenta]